MIVTWLDLLGAGLSGGLAVKIIDYLYQEYRRHSEAQRSARCLVERHIDPILKSADELVGKIRSLAQSDFRELIRTKVSEDVQLEDWFPYLSLLFLFAQFWSRIQIIRIESLFVNLGSDERGKQLLDFFNALEATRTRLVDRSWQRGMGEALLEYTDNNEVRCINYNEFANRFLSSENFKKWFKPLISLLLRLNHTRERQRFLTYGVILHALLETLDSKYLITKNRPGWANKLSTKSKRDLKFRIFRVYLPFVKKSDRYIKT
jgi:hypothetical protein